MNNYDIEKQKTLIVKIYHENSQSLLFLKKTYTLSCYWFFFNLYYLYMCLWSFPDFSVNLYTLFYNLIYLWTAWSLVNYWI